MSLNLPTNFKADLEGRDTALVPLVVIGTHTTTMSWADTNDWFGSAIHLSTNSMIVESAHAGVDDRIQVTTKPIILNIPFLKESIDIDKRNYKISSVNIDISNFPYEGQRFSELISQRSLINTECRIYWMTPSSRWVFPNEKDQNYSSGQNETVEGMSYQIYFGTIRRYTHDDEKVRLVVEDRSQAKLHTDLPLENLGDNAVSKYKNKPKPMVYGHVDKSPCVIASAPILDDQTLLEGEIDIIPDIDNSISFVGDNPLYVEKEGSYINIPTEIQEIKFASGLEYGAVTQYTISGKSILLQSLYEYSSGSEGVGSNPISNNKIIGFETLTPTSVHPLRIESGKDTLGKIYYATISDNTFSGFPFTIKGTLFREQSGDDWDETSKIFDEIGEGTDIWWNINSPEVDETLVGCTMEIPIISESAYTEDAGYIRAKFGMNFYNKVQWTGTFSGFMWRLGGNVVGDYESDVISNQTAAGTEVSPNWIPDAQPTYDSLTGSDSPVWISNVGQLLFYMQIDHGYSIMVGQTILEGIEVDHWMLMENLFNMDFYANVNGRNMTDAGESPTAPSTIAHILERELLVGNVPSVTNTDYSDWQYAFTVDKKINSKKLIEGIASASPYIPRFNNMGEFKFTEIPVSGGTADHTIKEADCIDFSFSRSSIESVFSKIIFKYNWDYARGEFNDSVTAELGDGIVTDYKYEYYGLLDDHSESTLTIDGEQGKYIRDHTTAENFAYWYLMWSCNQKLKLKIRLGLKYMNLEIGDLVDFDAILGGVKPYGIDYVDQSGTDGDKVNGQYVFTTFLITSTNKTLEWVEIEAIMMHNLDIDVVVGCMDENNCNYDEDAGIHNPTQCLELDCNDDCGGSAVIDSCDVCSGGDTGYTGLFLDPSDTCFSCENGEDLEFDECGTCGGDGMPYGANHDCDGNCIVESDCLGACGGSATEDNCGVCNGDGSTCLPNADAGSDQTVAGSGTLVTLDGSGSDSGTGEIIAYEWNQLTGTAVQLSDDESVITTFEAPDVQQQLSFRLTIANSNLTTDADEITVTVNNDPPYANAGLDQEVYAGSTVTLAGSGSTDDVEIIAYEWNQLEGIAVQLSDDENVTTTFTAPTTFSDGGTAIGSTLKFRLSVYDGVADHQLDTDEIEITIVEEPECTTLIGDVNGDGGWNVLDVVTLVNCVLAGGYADSGETGVEDWLTCNEIEFGCAGDMNNDGNWNILDVVTLVNCVLDDNCEDFNV